MTRLSEAVDEPVNVGESTTLVLGKKINTGKES
jgi:hypothetical protein